MVETVLYVSSQLSFHHVKSPKTTSTFPSDRLKTFKFVYQRLEIHKVVSVLPYCIDPSTHLHPLRMDLTAVKRVESPVKYKQLKPVMNSNSDNHIQYEIQFPAGSMGLELEPVIISSERKIGCRVKDFYFGVDYTGTEEDCNMLQGTISIGDILMKINGVSVVSLPFTSVLDMLRSLTSTERVVVFKNLTKSCKFI